MSFFEIKYTLFDKFGNPTNNQYIWITTSVPGEEKKFLSNNLGQVVVQYGPRSSNRHNKYYRNSCFKQHRHHQSGSEIHEYGAEIISLTANPDTMASHDANPSRIADILALVADHLGNAVPGESVTSQF